MVAWTMIWCLHGSHANVSRLNIDWSIRFYHLISWRETACGSRVCVWTTSIDANNHSIMSSLSLGHKISIYKIFLYELKKNQIRYSHFDFSICIDLHNLPLPQRCRCVMLCASMNMLRCVAIECLNHNNINGRKCTIRRWWWCWRRSQKALQIYIQITICQSFLDARDSRCPGRSRFQHIAQRGETAEKEKRKFDLSFEHLIGAETAAAAAVAAASATQMVNG